MKVALFLAKRAISRDRKRGVLLVVTIATIMAIITAISVARVNLTRLDIATAEVEAGRWHLAFIAGEEGVIDELKDNWVVESASLGYRLVFPFDSEFELDLTLFENQQFEVFTPALIRGVEPTSTNEIAVSDWVLRLLELETLPAQITVDSTELTITGVFKGRASDIQAGVITAFGVIEGNEHLLTMGFLADSPSRLANQYIYEVEGVPAFVYIRVDPHPVNVLPPLEEITGLEQFNRPDIYGDGDTSPAYNLQLILAERRMAQFTIGADAIPQQTRDVFVNLLLVFALFGFIVIVMNMIVNNAIRMLGIFASLGIEPRDIRTYLLMQACFSACIAIPLGIILGGGASYIVVDAIAGDFLGEISIPVTDIVAFSLFATLAIIVGSAYPAIKAAQLQPLHAFNIHAGIGDGDVATASRIRLDSLKGKLFPFLYGLKEYCKVNFKSVGLTILIAGLLGMYILMSSTIEYEWKMESRRLPYLSDYVVTLPYIEMGDMESGFNPTLQPVDSTLRNELESIVGIKDVYYQHSVVDGYIVRGMLLQEAEGIYHYEWKVPDSALSPQGREAFSSYYYFRRADYPDYRFIWGGVSGYEDKGLEFAREYLVEGNIDIERMKNEPVIILPKYVAAVGAFDAPYVELEIGDEITLFESDVIVDGYGFALETRNTYTFTIGGFVDPLPLPQVSGARNGFVGIMHVNQLEQLQSQLIGVKEIYLNGQGDFFDKIREIVQPYGYSVESNKGFGQMELHSEAAQMQQILYTMFGTVAGGLFVIMFMLFRAEILARRREFAVLSAIGMGRWQTFVAVITQFMLPAVLACILGSVGAILLLYYQGGYGYFTSAQMIPWRHISGGIVVVLLAPLLATLLTIPVVLRRFSIQDVKQE